MKRIAKMIALAILAAGLGAVVGERYAAAGKEARARAQAAAPDTTAATTAVAVAAKPAAKPARKILYWWDPMLGPASISPKPGISAMGMTLVPVYASGGDAGSPGEVTIDPGIEQNLAVATRAVRFGTLHKTVRTVGDVRRATPVVYTVTPRTSGWIGTLYATTDGTAIRKGDPLFTLYSPQLLAAEQELLAAAGNVALAGRSGDDNAAVEARRIFHSIRMRLVYLGVSAAQLDRIVAAGKAQEYLTFPSPVSGYLANVAVRQRSFLSRGEAVMRIDQLRHVWLDAQVYEDQLPWLRLGQTMRAHLAADPGHTAEGRIFFIDPNEDPRTHTVTVRAQIPNPAGLLRPGMYALVDILTAPLGRSLLAPASAIIHTGTSEVALVAQGHGRFVPRTVTTGLTGSDGMVEVLSGLKSGEHVVTSGQFLIDVESNMREVTAKFRAQRPAAQPATAGSAGSGAGSGSMAGMKMPGPPTAAGK